MGKITYVRKGESKYNAFKREQRIKEKMKKRGSFLSPSRVYGRKVRTVRRRRTVISNPSGVSVLKRVFPTKKHSKKEMPRQSASEFVFG